LTKIKEGSASSTGIPHWLGKNRLASSRKADYVVLGWVVKKCQKKTMTLNKRAAAGSRW